MGIECHIFLQLTHSEKSTVAGTSRNGTSSTEKTERSGPFQPLVYDDPLVMTNA